MNEIQPFYPHESDNGIMVKKDLAEVANWTDELEYIHEELEYFLDIEDSMLQNSDLYQQLLTIRRENTLRLARLHRYETTMAKAIECDTIECDAYYLHHHEKNRNAYIEHIKNYRNIKTKTLSSILLDAK